MAELSDADQGGFSLPRFNSGRAHRAGPRDFSRPRATRGLPRHPGVAELLLQVAYDQPGALPRARFVHPIHEAEKHAALDDGPRSDHPPRSGILRLAFLVATSTEFAAYDIVPNSATRAGCSIAARFFARPHTDPGE